MTLFPILIRPRVGSGSSTLQEPLPLIIKRPLSWSATTTIAVGWDMAFVPLLYKQLLPNRLLWRRQKRANKSALLKTLLRPWWSLDV